MMFARWYGPAHSDQVWSAALQRRSKTIFSRIEFFY